MENEKSLRLLGWKVIRFWGQDITKNPNECIRVIDEAILDFLMDKLGD